MLATKLRKSTLKKLIKDTCMKTAFSYNNKLNKQIDAVSIGSSLGPVLANIKMTKLEKIVVSVVVNAFDDNLKFTIDKFTNNNFHFLDIKIDRNETDLFYKTTRTG